MRFSIDVRPQIQEHEGMKITVSLDTYKALTQLLEHEEDTYDAVVWRLLGNSNKQTPSQGSSSQENELHTRTPDTDSTTATPTTSSPISTISNPSESSATPNTSQNTNQTSHTSQTDDTNTANNTVNNTTNTPTGTPPPPAAMTAATAVAPTSATSATAVNPTNATNADAVKTETQPNEDDNAATHYFEYGVKLLIGTQLRRRYKGKEYVATVHAKGLKLDGQNYASLSEAAGAITEYEMNGWAFWQYQDPKNGKWEPVARLRKTTSTAEH